MKRVNSLLVKSAIELLKKGKSGHLAHCQVAQEIGIGRSTVSNIRKKYLPGLSIVNNGRPRFSAKVVLVMPPDSSPLGP